METECIITTKTNKDGSLNISIKFDPPLDMKSDQGKELKEWIKSELIKDIENEISI